MRNILLFVLLCLSKITFSQKLTEADSLLRLKYYQHIFPVALNSKSNMLYEGIDNPLAIRFPDEDSKKLKYLFKTHNGIIFQSDSYYVTVPKNSGRAFISTFLITETDTILIGKKEFAVQKVPLPSLKFGGVVIQDQSVIDRGILLRPDSVKVYFSDDIIGSENWCTAEHFNIGYSFGGRYISIDNKGPLLTRKTREFISKLKSNENVVIKVTNINCSLIYKNLPLVRFKLK